MQFRPVEVGLDESVTFWTLFQLAALGPWGRAYLVSDDTVYSFAPSQETLETAVQNARTLANGPN